MKHGDGGKPGEERQGRVLEGVSRVIVSIMWGLLLVILIVVVVLASRFYG